MPDVDREARVVVVPLHDVLDVVVELGLADREALRGRAQRRQRLFGLCRERSSDGSASVSDNRLGDGDAVVEEVEQRVVHQDALIGVPSDDAAGVESVKHRAA